MAKRKNILLITADQLRADALGCYGNTYCRTPNVDRLAAGCPLPKAAQGIDLTKVMVDPTVAVRELYYSQYSDGPYQTAMVTDGKWKFCWTQEGSTEELYDLVNDTDELVNLVSKPGNESCVKEWRHRLMEEARRLGDTSIFDGDKLVHTPFDPESMKHLPISGMGWRWY
jgi:arylsulfatase A-like enzyme